MLQKYWRSLRKIKVFEGHLTGKIFITKDANNFER